MIRWTTGLLSLLLTASLANAMILPKNKLYREDDINHLNAIDEELFNKISDETVALFEKVARDTHHAKLTVVKRWTDPTVNAYAEQEGDVWKVTMFGGLARRPEIQPDSFAMVVCHELGHHFGGYPLKGARWAANEGQSDYFATQQCAKTLWANQLEENKKFRETVDPTAKAMCDKVWKNEPEQNLCYRSSQAGLELATLLAKLGDGTQPKFDTPDTHRVSRTDDAHPAAQCRLDTYMSGSICTAVSTPEVIPGKNNPDGQQSPAAEIESAKYTCFVKSGFQNGLRPRCWFAPLNETYRKWFKGHF